MTNVRHAEIAGAGLAGLFTATVLGRKGWSVRVHERSAELREIGAGIAIWQNGVWALREAGLYEQALDCSIPKTGWRVFDQEGRCLQRDQEWMTPTAFLEGLGGREFLRTDLHRMLVEAAKASGAEIETSSVVEGAGPDGHLILADGRRLAADLVIGADGVHSRVRDSLRLAERVYGLDDGAGRHLTTRELGEEERVLEEHWNGARRIGIVPVGRDQLYIYLSCPADDSAGRAQDTTREPWLTSFPHLRKLIERIPDGGNWMEFHDVIVTSWSKGQAALVGDAAHAMSPGLGQAVNVAWCNIVALGQALDAYPDDLATALDVWEHSQRPVTDRTQLSSRWYDASGTKWPRALSGLRSKMVEALAAMPQLQRQINPAIFHVPMIHRTGAGSSFAAGDAAAPPDSTRITH